MWENLNDNVEIMPEPSIVNWLNNDIDDGEDPSCFYIANLANHNGFMALRYCKLTDKKD